MLRTCLLGLSALAMVSAATSGAAAKAPPCRDAKGHAVACAKPKVAAPAPDSGACLWLIAHGIFASCTLV